MTITDVIIKPVINIEPIKAYVSVVLDNALVIHNIRIIDNGNKTFLAMPNRECADGGFKDIVHPISTNMRKMLTDAILERYEVIKLSEMVNKL